MGVSEGCIASVLVGGGAVGEPVVGASANGNGAVGSCSRKREKAAINRMTVARLMRNNWPDVRFFNM